VSGELVGGRCDVEEEQLVGLKASLDGFPLSNRFLGADFCMSCSQWIGAW
jgi:hypothetical protein